MAHLQRRVMETHQFCSHDIVIDILTLLPAKSLMRFKCVSKVWNTLIQHPNFVRSHYARSQACPSAARLLFQLKAYPKEQCCRSYHQNTSKPEVFSLELNCFCYNGNQMSVCSNNCNGLVCWYNYKYTQVYLYNVTTRELKPLPPLVNQKIIRSMKQGSYPKLFLGFDGNYKLLHVLYRRGKRCGKILTLGVTNSSWRKIGVIDDSDDDSDDDDNFSTGCIFLNGVVESDDDDGVESDDDDNFCTGCIFLNGAVYWYSSNSYVDYFNFREEKFGYIKAPKPRSLYSFGGPSIIRTALWGKLILKGPILMVYDDVKEVFTEVSGSGNAYIAVAATLLGAECINDEKKKVAYVLATGSVNCAPASMLSSSRLCFLRFVSSSDEHNNNKRTPRIVFKCVSCFVENITPLMSLLV